MKKKKWPKKIVKMCKDILLWYAKVASGEIEIDKKPDCLFCERSDSPFLEAWEGTGACAGCPCYTRGPAGFSLCVGYGICTYKKTFKDFKEAIRSGNRYAIRTAARARRKYLRRLFISKGIPI